MDKDYINYIKRNIAQKIRVFRFRNDLTQTELADKLGVSKSIISAYENGIRTPSLEALIQLSEVLEAPMGVFFSEPTASDIAPITVDVTGLSASQIGVVETVIRSFKIENEQHKED